MERQMTDLQEQNEQLQKAQLSESEAKNKLRQETSQLTAENMVCVKGHAQDYIICILKLLYKVIKKIHA